MAVAIPLALFCGVGVAVQSRINGEFAQQLGSSTVAALVSFGSGLVVLIVIVALSPTGRRGTARLVAGVRGGTFPWQFLFGGLVGALFVLSQGLSVGLLGIALFLIAVVAGQTLGSALLDRRGIGTMAPRAITWNRVVGAALALVAVVVAVSSQLRSDAVLWALVLPFLTGALMAYQQGANGQVREFTGSVLTATLNNFVLGTVLLLAIALVWSLSAGWPTQWPANPALYTGGVVGIVFIAIGALIVTSIGTLLLGLCTIAGELVASVLLDLLIPVPGHTLTITAVIGAGIALAAVVLATVRWGGISAAAPTPAR
jgi:transporter family-2 protein